MRRIGEAPRGHAKIWPRPGAASRWCAPSVLSSARAHPLGRKPNASVTNRAYEWARVAETKRVMMIEPDPLVEHLRTRLLVLQDWISELNAENAALRAELALPRSPARGVLPKVEDRELERA